MGYDEQAISEQDEAASFEEYHDNLQREYFQKPITVMCDIADCGRTGRGTRAALVAAGWIFPQGSELCSNHD